ncbi:hypothetical protein NQ315_014625 [Exocentrus adspersus]|uniref:Uncharacterized protein n=1 Tax=Exocentrus adspersus TaxID=1586481 RepID=A0AAV8VQH4_9CUCU|nr:hypothetical protein NQ315_014625 [Exocentrus adspersus]
MLSAQAFDMFRTPRMDESIEKVEWRTYYPYVKSFRNNDTIEITINQSDVFDAMYDDLLFISGKVTGAGDGNVALVNNAGAFMFSTITYEMNAKEIESVRERGLVSTVRGYALQDCNLLPISLILHTILASFPAVLPSILISFHSFLGMLNWVLRNFRSSGYVLAAGSPGNVRYLSSVYVCVPITLRRQATFSFGSDVFVDINHCSICSQYIVQSSTLG